MIINYLDMLIEKYTSHWTVTFDQAKEISMEEKAAFKSYVSKRIELQDDGVLEFNSFAWLLHYVNKQ